MAGIEDLLNKIIGTHLKGQLPTVTTGTIKDVDETNYTCTIEREDRPDLIGIRLNACEYDGSRFVQVPATDSVVLVCMIEGDVAEGLVIACSEIDKVLVSMGETTLEVNNTGVHIAMATTDFKINEFGVQIAGAVTIGGSLIINEGALGGLPKLNDLVSNLNSLKDYGTNLKAAVATALQQIPNGGSVASLNFNNAMAGKDVTLKDMGNEDLQQ